LKRGEFRLFQIEIPSAAIESGIVGDLLDPRNLLAFSAVSSVHGSIIRLGINYKFN